ncbi:MAG TPA: PIN domain-containing protein [Thiotrichaceae bacterium]|nr:PIN domain-containing protein [Thiotrichaceae bacterium]
MKTQFPFFLDANIFMSAAGKPHSYKEPCIRILSRVEKGELTAVINTEIIQELLYRYSHIGLVDKGIQLSRQALNLPLTVLPITVADINLAIKLFEKHEAAGLTARDAIHAATLHQNGYSHILSTDKDFDLIDFVNRVDPLEFL